MLPVSLIVVAALVYLLCVVYPRLDKRGKRRLEQRDRRFRNRLRAVATPVDDDDQVGA